MRFNLYLVRHGETYLNKYQKMQGWSNTPLTEKGINDMKIVREKLSLIKFDTVLTSDLSRTIESAKLIMQNNQNFENVKMESYPKFRETFFGGFEGQDNDETWNYVVKQSGYDSMVDMFENVGVANVLDLFKKHDPKNDAESTAQFYERLESSLRIILEKVSENGNLLLISHGNFIRHFVSKYSGQLIKKIDNSTCLVLECDSEKEKLIQEVKFI